MEFSAAAEKIWVFPGTFDPITRGHEALIQRARQLCDRLIIAVVEEQPHKQHLFSAAERLALVRRVCGGGNCQAELFSGLLAHFCRASGAVAIVRGLRNHNDFFYEQNLAEINGHLGLETVFLNARASESLISSSMVKELARLGGDYAPYVSVPVAEKIRQTLFNPLK